MIGQAQLQQLWANVLALGTRRLAILGVVAATVFGAIASGSFYLSRPDFETLYAGLSSPDVSRIGAVLIEAGIPFDVSSEGTKVMVRVGEASRARMLLAERGLPNSSASGYELFDKLGPMSLTSFMQEVTKVRALEGEIARTIQVMKGVKAARVHLVLPDQGSFRRKEQHATASVVVHFDGRDPGSAGQAIRLIVSAAVPGMAADQVSVLDTSGTVLAASGDGGKPAVGKTVELEKAVDRDIQDNVRRTLAPYLGSGNVEVSVSSRLNVDRRQTNETTYDPESKVERSVRVIRDNGSSQNTANRAPVGVEQNLPPEQSASGATPGEQSRKSNDRRDELTNFEVNSKSTTTISEGYRIEALNVAVVINRKRLLSALGTPANPDEIEKQIKELERLASTAAGIDQKRGDKITVTAVDFAQGTATLEPEPAISLTSLLAKQMGSLVRAITIISATAMLVWFGLRPITRLLAAQQAPAAIASNEMGQPLGNAGEGASNPHELPPPAGLGMIAEMTTKAAHSSKMRLEEIVELSEEQAARVLKQWMRRA